MLVAKVSTKGIVNINKQKCFTVFKVGSKMQVTSRDYIQSGKLDIKCLANGVECVKGQNALTCTASCWQADVWQSFLAWSLSPAFSLKYCRPGAYSGWSTSLACLCWISFIQVIVIQTLISASIRTWLGSWRGFPVLQKASSLWKQLEPEHVNDLGCYLRVVSWA